MEKIRVFIILCSHFRVGTTVNYQWKSSMGIVNQCDRIQFHNIQVQKWRQSTLVSRDDYSRYLPITHRYIHTYRYRSHTYKQLFLIQNTIWLISSCPKISSCQLYLTLPIYSTFLRNQCYLLAQLTISVSDICVHKSIGKALRQIPIHIICM